MFVKQSDYPRRKLRGVFTGLCRENLGILS